MNELTECQVAHWYATWLAEVLHDSTGPTPATVGRRLGLIDGMAEACRETRCRQFAEYRARRAEEVSGVAAALGALVPLWRAGRKR